MDYEIGNAVKTETRSEINTSYDGTGEKSMFERINATYEITSLLQLGFPVCEELNPYVAKNDGWVPEHIWHAPRRYYSYLAIYTTFLTILCSFLNGTVIIATIKFKAVRQPLNYVIVNLAVVDFLAGIVGGFVSFFVNIYGYFFWGKWMCQFEGYMVANFSLASLNTIAVMALERYFVVCQPLGNVPFTHKASIIAISLTWLVSICWNTPPLLFWNGYDLEGFGTGCAPNWFVKTGGPRYFIISYFLFAFAVPFLGIIFCYGSLLYKLRKITKASSLTKSSSHQSDVLKMVITMVTAFLVCWLPYASFALYNMVNPDAQIDYALGAIPSFFAKTATLYNPLIYICSNRQFRDAVIRMFCNGRNPWSSDYSSTTPSTCSQVNSQVTVVGQSNKVGPA